MQSSLTRVLPFVLGFSPRPPVSVCGTGTFDYLATFLASVNSSTSLLYFSPRHSLAFMTCVLHYKSASLFRRIYPSTRFDYPSVSLHHYHHRWCRNINRLSIIYAFRPQLRSRLTLGGRTFPRKPQTFDGKDSHFALATYAGILSCVSSTTPFGTASAFTHCSSTNLSFNRFPNFGVKF